MGFFDIIAWPFSYVFEVCYKIVSNYGLALILFALFVKILLLPLGIKQQKNQIKMAKLRPQMYLIEKKYAGRTDRVTMQKKQQEMMELQMQAGASPLSGCLPLLIQFPVIIGLYEIVRKPLTWLCRFSKDTIVALNTAVGGGELEYSKIDQITLVKSIKENIDVCSGVEGFVADKLPNLNMFGQSLGTQPSFSNFSWLTFIPFIVFLTSYLSMKLTRKLMSASQPQQTPDQAMSMKIMDFAMPLISLFFAFNFSSALGMYWIYQTVFSALQSVILAYAMPLPKYTVEELKAMERDMKKNRTSANPDRVTCRDENKPVRSLHYIDEDDDDIPSRVITQPKKKGNQNVGKAKLKNNQNNNRK